MTMNSQEQDLMIELLSTIQLLGLKVVEILEDLNYVSVYT